MPTVKRRQEQSFGDVVVSLSPFPQFAADGDDGPLTITFRTLEVGAKHQEGKGDLTVTPKMIAQMKANFDHRLSRGYRTPVVLGHPGIGEKTSAKAWEKRIEAEAKGWVDAAEAKPDGLWVTVTFTDKDFAAKVRAKGYQFNSPSFSTRWVDEFGVDRGAALIDVGILNYPLQEGIGTLMAASAFAFAMEGQSMDPETLNTIVEAVLAKLKEREVEEASKAPPAKEGEAPPPDADVEKVKTDMAAARAELVSLSAKINDQIVALRAQTEEATKATKDTLEKAHAADCLAFLSAIVDDGKLAPARLPKDWKEKPAAAFAKLGFNSLASARENFAAIPKNAVVNLAAAQSREGATGAADSLSDSMWQASSLREEFIARHGGDEAAARRDYASKLSMMPADVED